MGPVLSCLLYPGRPGDHKAQTSKNFKASTWISMLYCIRCSSHSPRLTKSSMLSKRPRAVCERVGQSHQRHHTHYMYTYTRLIWPTSKGRVRYSRPIRTRIPGIDPLARGSVDSAHSVYDSVRDRGHTIRLYRRGRGRRGTALQSQQSTRTSLARAPLALVGSPALYGASPRADFTHLRRPPSPGRQQHGSNLLPV